MTSSTALGWGRVEQFWTDLGNDHIRPLLPRSLTTIEAWNELPAVGAGPKVRDESPSRAGEACRRLKSGKLFSSSASLGFGIILTLKAAALKALVIVKCNCATILVKILKVL